jgi:hypothetical protein
MWSRTHTMLFVVNLQFKPNKSAHNQEYGVWIPGNGSRLIVHSALVFDCSLLAVVMQLYIQETIFFRLNSIGKRQGKEAANNLQGLTAYIHRICRHVIVIGKQKCPEWKFELAHESDRNCNVFRMQFSCVLSKTCGWAHCRGTQYGICAVVPIEPLPSDETTANRRVFLHTCFY